MERAVSDQTGDIPTPEQLAAIESRDLDILVEAGAGTGKTSTTIARYRRILGDGHAPGQILVFTFTDKAAAELRNRVREHHSAGDPSMSSAWIGTFHAVCARILRSHPVAANVDPRFEILNDVIGKRIKDLAFERALTEVSADRRNAEWLSRERISEWKKGVAATYDQLRARGQTTPELPDAPAGQTATAGLDFEVVSFELVNALLLAYGNEYAKIKEASGVLDYEDLQLGTLALLEAHPAIRQSYRERFVEIMVDEFQDTNRLQLSLIEALRGDDTTLFTVGDEMQAIYGFRYADVRLFRKRRDRVDRPLGLTANFRSQAPVIGAVNHIGRALDSQVSTRRTSENADDTGRQQFTDLTVGLNPDERPSRVETILLPGKGWKEQDLGPLSPEEAKGQGDAKAAVCAEALAVARRIHEAVSRGEVEPGGVAILFRTRGNMNEHAAALAQHGLGAYIVGRRDFWESREAVDIKALLSVVANPLDDESLLSPLFGPACGLSSDAVLLLRKASGSSPLWPALKRVAAGDAPEGFPAADRDLATDFVEAIQRVRHSLATTPLSEVADATITSTGYDLACLARDRGAEGMANLRRLVSLAAEYEAQDEQAGGGDLRGFIDWISDSAELKSEDGVATQEEGGDVVRLMTIHKAKGLEFDMVCVPDLGKQRPFKNQTICWLAPEGDGRETEDGDPPFGLYVKSKSGDLTPTHGWDTIKSAAQAEAEDEELRLLHVAMTRARRILLLSGSDSMEGSEPRVGDHSARRLVNWFNAHSDEAEGSSRVPPLFAVPAPDAGVALDQEPAESEMVVTVFPATTDSAGILRSGGDVPVAEVPSPEGRPPLSRPEPSRRPDVPLSFTTLSVLKDCPARFFATQVLKIAEPEGARTWQGQTEVVLDPEEQSPLTVREATAFGLAIHEVLESCAKRRWVRPAAAEIEHRLRLRGLDPSDPDVLDRATVMIFGFLDSELGGKVSAQRCDLEIPLLFDAGGITIRGFADLLCPQSEPPLILDYKSNRLEGTNAEAKMTEQYGLQRDLYGLAVARGLGVECVDTAFVFLEDVSHPVEMRLGRDELEHAGLEVEGLTAMIRTGSFFGQPGAAVRPCGGCWACEQLASRIVSSAK